MKSVIVTGATGFIGGYAVKELAAMGYKVHAISSRDTPIENSNQEISWSKVDLFNFIDVANLLEEIRATHLLHFAWCTDHGKFWNSFENYGWMHATHNLVKNFIKNGGKRFVVSGSCAEYNWRRSRYLETEKVGSQNTLYGQIKNLTRLDIHSLANENNVSYGWGRVFYLYGYGENSERLVPLIIKSLISGERFKCTDGKQLRDYMHVEDVARAFSIFLSSQIEGVVNIASGRSIEIREIIDIVAEYLGAINLVDYGAIKSRKDDPHIICADIRRLKNELEFKELWTVKEGLQNVVNQTLSFHNKEGLNA